MGTTPTTEPAWKAQPINMKQAQFIGRLLPEVFPSNFSTHGEGGGFSQWVPGWSEPEGGFYSKQSNPEGVYSSLHAANLLGELGITKGNASDAISYLRRMKGRGDARLATFSDRLGLSVTGAKVQSGQSYDQRALLERIAKLEADALERQAVVAVVNGGEVGEPADLEPEQEQEVEAASEEDSPLPF